MASSGSLLICLSLLILAYKLIPNLFEILIGPSQTHFHFSVDLFTHLQLPLISYHNLITNTQKILGFTDPQIINLKLNSKQHTPIRLILFLTL